MSSSARIPPLLEHYLALPPESSLVLLTSVLGASANWLVLRHLYAYLRGSSGGGSGDEEAHKDTGVVLVSFMRDAAFWREGAAKLGLDLDALGRAGRVVLVDGLTGLTGGEVSGTATRGGVKVLRSTRLEDVERDVKAAVAELGTRRRVLVVDQLDAVLAISDEETTSLAVQNLLLSLRGAVHSTVATLSADGPLVAAQATRLEREQAGLVVATAHVADVVMGVRMLDTGTARDVSGVVRVTTSMGGEAVEVLYHVAADGGVRVFERGS